MGAARHMHDAAFLMAKEKGYTAVSIEYPRGYSRTDTFSGPPPTDWFCTTDPDSFMQAVSLAYQYSELAMDAIMETEIRYRSDEGACLVLDPIDICFEPPGTSPESVREIVSPSAVYLLGSSAGASIIWHLTLFNDPAPWKIKGAVPAWGAFGTSALAAIGGSENLFKSVPIFSIHNPCDSRSPYWGGRPYGLPDFCCTNYPTALGGKYIVSVYQNDYDADPGSPGRILQVSTCDRKHNDGWYIQPDPTDIDTVLFQALEDLMWWTPQADAFAAGGFWEMVLNADDGTGSKLFAWQGECEETPCASCP